MDTLVSRQLLLQQADKLGISLSDAQIVQMIHQQPSFQVNGQFSDEAVCEIPRINWYDESRIH